MVIVIVFSHNFEHYILILRILLQCDLEAVWKSIRDGEFVYLFVTELVTSIIHTVFLTSSFLNLSS